jgi:hypothetical protein
LQKVTNQHLGTEAEVLPVHVYNVILLQELKKKEINAMLLERYTTNNTTFYHNY